MLYYQSKTELFVHILNLILVVIKVIIQMKEVMWEIWTFKNHLIDCEFQLLINEIYCLIKTSHLFTVLCLVLTRVPKAILRPWWRYECEIPFMVPKGQNNNSQLYCCRWLRNLGSIQMTYTSRNIWMQAFMFWNLNDWYQNAIYIQFFITSKWKPYTRRMLKNLMDSHNTAIM